MVNAGADWDRARAILAVRLDGMGDLLMTTPALRALKLARRDRTLTLLTSPAGARVARELPFVDEVIEFAAPWMKHELAATSRGHLAALLNRLSPGRFDAGVIFTMYSQGALPAATVLYLAGVPRRAAYTRENPYHLLTDWLGEPDLDPHAGVRHEVARQIELVAALGVKVIDTRLEFPIRPEARGSMRRKAIKAGADATRPWLVLHPGASAASRRYPVEAFAAVAQALSRQIAWQVIIAGGPEDIEATAAMGRAAPAAISLAGQLSFVEFAALVQAAWVVVCNNSVTVHLASALETAVVDLYALTNPQHTPWGVPHRVLFHDVDCKYCLKSICPRQHHRRLAAVAPEEVVAAVGELTAERAPANSTARRCG